MAASNESKDRVVRPAINGEGEAVAASGDRGVALPFDQKINVDDFGRLAVTMSWLLTEFSQVKPLRDAGLGLGDWAVLAILARSDSVAKKLSRNLGIPVQRVASIVDSLTQDGFTSTEPLAGGGKIRRVIKITDAGRIKLEAVNAELTVALGMALKSRSLRGALKQVTVLSRLLRAASLQGV